MPYMALWKVLEHAYHYCWCLNHSLILVFSFSWLLMVADFWSDLKYPLPYYRVISQFLFARIVVIEEFSILFCGLAFSFL